MNPRLVPILLLAAFPLAAQDTPPAPEAGATTVTDPIVVTGSRRERSSADLPFAVTTVERDVLEDAGPQINLSEALARVPGLTINNRQNYAQDLQINSRGFGARASFGVRGLRLYTDSIPATAPDGQGQVSHFNLGSAQRIEVLRGPFSALYGNSSGGVIALISREPRETSVSADYDFGEFGLRQWRLGGETRFAENWSALAEYSDLELDGYRPHGAAERRLGFGRLAWRGERDRVVLTLSRQDQPAQDPLGLTRAQFDENPRQTASQATLFNTRKDTEQQQLGLAWQRTLEAGPLRELAWSGYAGQREVRQFQSIPLMTQAPPRHPGGVIDLERGYYGGDARATLQWGALQVIAGLNLEEQDEDRRGFENFRGSGEMQVLGVLGALRRDEDNLARNFDQYLQAEMALAERWIASAGVRHGEIRLESDDAFLANGDDSDETDFDYTNPVAGLLFQASDELRLYASAGRGFEAPTLNELAYRSDGSSGFNTALDAQTSDQFEVGAKLRRTNWNMDLALFLADTDDELVVQTNAGGRSTFGNAGSTRRYGAEASLQWRIMDSLQTRAALTWLDATYRDGFLTCAAVPCMMPTLEIPKDNRIPATAEYAAFVEMAWTPRPLNVTFAAELRAQSDIAVNDANSDFASGYGLLAVRAERRFDLQHWSLRLDARVDNLFDREYAGSVIVNEGNGRFFEPGAPRTALLSIKLSRRL